MTFHRRLMQGEKIRANDKLYNQSQKKWQNIPVTLIGTINATRMRRLIRPIQNIKDMNPSFVNPYYKPEAKEKVST